MKLARDVRACAETMEYIHSWTLHRGPFLYRYAIWRDSKELGVSEEEHWRNRAEEEIKKLLTKIGIDTP
jgi:hypothetical protein